MVKPIATTPSTAFSLTEVNGEERGNSEDLYKGSEDSEDSAEYTNKEPINNWADWLYLEDMEPDSDYTEEDSESEGLEFQATKSSVSTAETTVTTTASPDTKLQTTNQSKPGVTASESKTEGLIQPGQLPPLFPMYLS